MSATKPPERSIRNRSVLGFVKVAVSAIRAIEELLPKERDTLINLRYVLGTIATKVRLEDESDGKT